jgi:hypothetical protein
LSHAMRQALRQPDERILPDAEELLVDRLLLGEELLVHAAEIGLVGTDPIEDRGETCLGTGTGSGETLEEDRGARALRFHTNLVREAVGGIRDGREERRGTHVRHGFGNRLPRERNALGDRRGSGRARLGDGRNRHEDLGRMGAEREEWTRAVGSRAIEPGGERFMIDGDPGSHQCGEPFEEGRHPASPTIPADDHGVAIAQDLADPSAAGVPRAMLDEHPDAVGVRTLDRRPEVERAHRLGRDHVGASFSRRREGPFGAAAVEPHVGAGGHVPGVELPPCVANRLGFRDVDSQVIVQA